MTSNTLLDRREFLAGTVAAGTGVAQAGSAWGAPARGETPGKDLVIDSHARPSFRTSPVDEGNEGQVHDAADWQKILGGNMQRLLDQRVGTRA